MAQPPINVALIGFGFSGRVFHAPFLKALKEYNLCSIISSNPEKVRAMLPNIPVYPDICKAFHKEDLELIVIATPNETHYALAKAALESGKHVVVDKPFTINSKEALDLIQIAKRQKRILTVYHNRRWDGNFLTIKKLLKENLLGDVYLYEAHYHRYRPIPNPERWKEKANIGSGILYDLGAHLLDQALNLFGYPDSMEADVISQRPGAVTDDYFHLILKYGAKRVILKSSSLVHHPGPRYQLHGTKGSFLKNGIDPQEQDLIEGKSPLDKTWGQDKKENDGILVINHKKVQIPTVCGNYAAFYQRLARAIYKNTNPPILPEEAYQVVNLIEKLHQR